MGMIVRPLQLYRLRFQLHRSKKAKEGERFERLCVRPFDL
jgi:hypothetical protein